jgi:predicted nucleotidyltransferase
MFTLEERDELRSHVLELGRRDDRIVGAAVVGSLASGEGDQFSDLDLAFAISKGVAVPEVLGDWTEDVCSHFDAVHLFDLVVDSTIYRVFLLPGCLQLDLSLAPADEFFATSPRFRLLFGSVKQRSFPPPSRNDLLGWAVLYARDARICIERGRWLQAEYCIASLRHRTMDLACLRLELPPRYGKGYDRLPEDNVEGVADTLVRSLDRGELLRALSSSVNALVRECSDDGEATLAITKRLREVLA